MSIFTYPTVVYVQDDLESFVDASGFRESFQDGILSLVILIGNPHRQLLAMLSVVSQN